MILCKKGPPCLCGPPWTNDWLPWKNISDLDADELEFMAVQLPTLKKSMRHGSTRDVETLSYKIRPTSLYSDAGSRTRRTTSQCGPYMPPRA